MTRQQGTEVAQPGVRPFDDPASAVAPEPAADLMCRFRVVRPLRDNRFDPERGEPFANAVAVVAAIGDQSVRVAPRPPRSVRPADRNRAEGGFEEADFRWVRRVQVCSQRSTPAIDQYHPLCALAALGGPDSGPPFFAGAKLPSTKHSFQRIFSRSFRSARNARLGSSSVPSASHRRSRRQHVVGLPNWGNGSLHGAPVHSAQRMPSKHLRSSAGGRPPRSRRGRLGRCSSMRAHCLLLTPRHAMPHRPMRGHQPLRGRNGSEHSGKGLEMGSRMRLRS